MPKSIRFAAVLLLGGASAGNLTGEQASGPSNVDELRSSAVVSWSAPLYWSPGAGVDSDASIRGKSTTVSSPSALPFIAIPPCRLGDTRDPSFPPGFGPPSLVGGAARTFTLPGHCGLPIEAAAYSLNVTVVPPANPPFSYLSIYPTGGSPPAVSTLNWGTGGTSTVYFNAAIVPAGTGGGIDVFVSSGTDLVLDVNGYYANDLSSEGGTFSFTTNSAFSTLSVTNSDTSGTNSSGGNFVTLSCGEGSAGVVGTANSAGSCGSTYGVLGNTVSPVAGSAGVFGIATSFANADTFGVLGLTVSISNTAAGVKGVGGYGGMPACATCLSAGVLGENTLGAGVQGVSTNLGTANAGTTGLLLDGSSGISLAGGSLGVTGPYGVFSEGDFGGTGAKYFVEPHPKDASKVIRYVALEGPEAGTYFRGTSQTHDGMAVIDVPETFRLVTETDGLTVQLTPVGEFAAFAVASADLDRIVVRSSKDVRFYYQVNGVRHGYAGFDPVSTSSEFAPRSANAKIPAYLNEAEKRAVISNGTYNADGTVNLEMATAQGWDQKWQASPK